MELGQRSWVVGWVSTQIRVIRYLRKLSIDGNMHSVHLKSISYTNVISHQNSKKIVKKIVKKCVELVKKCIELVNS